MFVQILKEFIARKIGERIAVSEADANALVAQQIAHPVSEDRITPAIQKAMVQAFAGFQKGLDAVINAQMPDESSDFQRRRPIQECVQRAAGITSSSPLRPGLNSRRHEIGWRCPSPPSTSQRMAQRRIET
jgi:hypothetical protein